MRRRFSATASALSTHPFNYIQERNNSALCRVKNYYSMRWITRLVDRWRTQQTVRPSLNCRHFDGRHFERILRYRVFSRYHACLRVGLLKAIAFLSAKIVPSYIAILLWLLYVWLGTFAGFWLRQLWIACIHMRKGKCPWTRFRVPMCVPILSRESLWAE